MLVGVEEGQAKLVAVGQNHLTVSHYNFQMTLNSLNLPILKLSLTPQFKQKSLGFGLTDKIKTNLGTIPEVNILKVYLKLLISEGDVGFHSCKAGPVRLKSESVWLRNGLVVKVLLFNIFPRESQKFKLNLKAGTAFHEFEPKHKMNNRSKLLGSGFWETGKLANTT